MKWPLHTQPVPRSQIPLYNRYYLHSPSANDPTIVWGTDVEVDELQAFLRDRNQHAEVVISPIHVLLQSVSRAVAKYPEFNCRVIGRRVYAYREINLRLAIRDRRRGGVGVILLERVNELSLLEIAQSVWSKSIEVALGQWRGERDCRRLQRLPSFLFHWLWSAYQWLDTRFRLPTVGRLDELRRGAVFVNDLSFYGAPPMRCYKPSRFPDESSAVGVTMGPAEEKVVVRHGKPQVAKVSPLIVRVDHRLVDAYQLGQFVATVRDYLQNPAVMDNSHLGELSRPGQTATHSVAGDPRKQRRMEAA